MAEESHEIETVNLSKKRRLGRKKGNKNKKKLKGFDGSGEKIKIDRKMKRLFRKRAREYNSDDDEDEGGDGRYAVKMKDESAASIKNEEALDGNDLSEEEEDHQDISVENEISEDEEGEIQPGITKFTEGCRAFRLAFKKIIKKNVSDVSLVSCLAVFFFSFFRWANRNRMLYKINVIAGSSIIRTPEASCRKTC